MILHLVLTANPCSLLLLLSHLHEHHDDDDGDPAHYHGPGEEENEEEVESLHTRLPHVFCCSSCMTPYALPHSVVGHPHYPRAHVAESQHGSPTQGSQCGCAQQSLAHGYYHAFDGPPNAHGGDRYGSCGSSCNQCYNLSFHLHSTLCTGVFHQWGPHSHHSPTLTLQVAATSGHSPTFAVPHSLGFPPSPAIHVVRDCTAF